MLLCQAIATMDLVETRRDMQGCRLDSMSMGIVSSEAGEQLLKFRLEFSGKGWFSKGAFVPVAPEVAAKMYHPTDCPYSKPVC